MHRRHRAGLSADARRRADDDDAWRHGCCSARRCPPAGWLGIAAICGGVVLLRASRRCGGGEGGSVCPGQRRGDRHLHVERCGRCADCAGAAGLHAVALSVVGGADVWWLRRTTPLHGQGARGGARICGAGASISAYALVLWAMTRAPVAPVAALRETSILDRRRAARLLLGERPTRRGWGGAVASRQVQQCCDWHQDSSRARLVVRRCCDVPCLSRRGNRGAPRGAPR